MLMKRTLFLGLACTLLHAGMSPGQEPKLPPTWGPPPVPALNQDGGTAPPAGFMDGMATSCCPASPRVWGDAEFLLWWTKRVPVNTPLFTQATNPADPTSGQIGSANTAILLGDRSYDLNTRYGGQFTLGAWFDSANTIGLEGAYLFIAPRSTTSQFSSNGSPSSPVLGSPFFNAFTGKEGFITLTGPGFAGSGALTVSNQLQSGELNLVGRLYQGQDVRITGLIGFRYVGFNENLAFSSNIQGLPSIAPGSVYSESDHFQASNNFYGGNLGLRGEYQIGGLSLNATAKCALGAMNQNVNVFGSAIDIDPGAPRAFNFALPTGIFALPTNIGNHSQTAFAVVPEVNFNLGYDITRNIRATVGYSFLYLSDVVRPGTVIDHSLNPTQSFSVASFGNSLVGPPAPTFSFSRSDFWAQGINFGLEFKF
jgi:hypothetical protein